MFVNYLEKIVARKNLSLEEMETAMNIIMEGRATEV